MGTLMLHKICINIFSLVMVFCSGTSGYSHYYLDTNKLCSYNSKINTIKIGENDESGIIVEESLYFKTFSGKHALSCKFQIESSSAMGIFAVIQNLDFRKNKTSGECIDYVQFRHAELFGIAWKKGNKTQGIKHCGHINALELDLSEIDPTDGNNLMPNAFIDTKGRINVDIYVANVPTTPEDKLNLRIVFTAYQVCRYNLGNYKKCGADGCIWHRYFKDSIVNCPFINCADEERCTIYYTDSGLKTTTGLATKVLVGAVAGVFTMFIVFIAFIWVFRHCGFCWSNPYAMPRSSPMIPITTTTHRDIRPSAPSRSPSLDKDLPPSYESLFPASNILV